MRDFVFPKCPPTIDHVPRHDEGFLRVADIFTVIMRYEKVFEGEKCKENVRKRAFHILRICERGKGDCGLQNHQ